MIIFAANAICALDELTEVGATELIIPVLEVEAVALVTPAEPSEDSASKRVIVVILVVLQDWYDELCCTYLC